MSLWLDCVHYFWHHWFFCSIIDTNAFQGGCELGRNLKARPDHGSTTWSWLCVLLTRHADERNCPQRCSVSRGSAGSTLHFWIAGYSRATRIGSFAGQMCDQLTEVIFRLLTVFEDRLYFMKIFSPWKNSDHTISWLSLLPVFYIACLSYSTLFFAFFISSASSCCPWQQRGFIFSLCILFIPPTTFIST